MKKLGADDWQSLEDTNFENFEVIRIDTRDFHCIATNPKHVKEVKNGMHKIPLEKYEAYSCKPIAEVKQWLIDFREMCGGVNDWRMLAFDVPYCYNWDLKYLNIVNYDGKVILTNKDNRSIKWGDLVDIKLCKEHLCAHNH